MSHKVLTNIFPCDPLESIELGRFVLLDNVPSNAESWFLHAVANSYNAKVSKVSSHSPMTLRAHDSTLIIPFFSGTSETLINLRIVSI